MNNGFQQKWAEIKNLWNHALSCRVKRQLLLIIFLFDQLIEKKMYVDIAYKYYIESHFDIVDLITACTMSICCSDLRTSGYLILNFSNCFPYTENSVRAGSR